ncbi:MAG: hypothetical protein LUC94_00535 [Clostridiales bacterium]|nr:hypothetical protein [Clostridiales bacterium]
MRIGRGIGRVLMILYAMTVFFVTPAMAETKKKISSVNISVEADIKPGARFGTETVEVETRSEKYYFDYYDLDMEGFEWEADMVPQIVIYLRAESGYYFSLTNASSVKLDGATYVKASKQDSSQTLKLTVKLTSLKESVADLEEVTLTDNGYAMWDEVQGAATYELRLYRNDQAIGVTPQSTDELSYNYQSMMNKAGTYYVKVRPVNGVNTSNKGDWVSSDSITLSKEQASVLRKGEGGAMPMTGEWVSDENGWRYQHRDSSYTQNGWEEIKGEWYFFDKRGYMQTGWIEWNDERYYCDNSGKMLRNTITPDGTILNSQGTPKTGN